MEAAYVSVTISSQTKVEIEIGVLHFPEFGGLIKFIMLSQIYLLTLVISICR